MNENYYIGTYMCFYASNPPSYPKQLCGECSHFEKCFDFLFNKKDMETKEVKIEIPEGYEIDESKSSFEKIIFKKKEKKLPKTYGGFINDYDYADRTQILVQKKYEQEFLALRMLIELRDVYNDGWKPDWKVIGGHYCIFYSNEEVRLDTRCSWHCILTFKTRELRDEFYNNFKDLIEQAKELL